MLCKTFRPIQRLARLQTCRGLVFILLSSFRWTEKSPKHATANHGLLDLGHQVPDLQTSSGGRKFEEPQLRLRCLVNTLGKNFCR